MILWSILSNHWDLYSSQRVVEKTVAARGPVNRRQTESKACLLVLPRCEGGKANGLTGGARSEGVGGIQFFKPPSLRGNATDDDIMIIRPAKRTESVQEYYFSRKLKEIAAMNADRASRGEEPVINLGIGSPDGMPPMQAVEALCESAQQTGNHAYQSYVGLPQLRRPSPTGIRVGMEWSWTLRPKSSLWWDRRRLSC